MGNVKISVQPKNKTGENVQVSYSIQFTEALDAGHCLLRRIFPNRSGKEQVTFQFIQRIKVPSSGASNGLVAKAQGIENLGTNLVTAVMSFKPEVATELGLPVGYYCNLDETVSAQDIFGEDVGIEITDSFSPNPYMADHQPVINPSTAKEMNIFNPEEGKISEYYRHTELRSADSVSHQFIGDAVKALQNGAHYREYDRGTANQVSQEEGKEINFSEGPAEALSGTGEGDTLDI